MSEMDTLTETPVEAAIRGDARTLPGDAAMAARLLARVQAARQAPRQAAVAPASASPYRRSWSRRLGVAASVSFLATVTGLASAQVLGWLQVFEEPLELPAPAPARRLGRERPAVPPAPASLPVFAPEPVPAPASPPVFAPRVTPAMLFADAGQARGRGQPRRAADLFERLQARFPASREAALAHVSLGRLYLDQLDRPTHALRAFDLYLRTHADGTLAHEALVGRAQSLRRLGRGSQEARAWSTLLERFPDTLLRVEAEQRLRVLGR